MEALLIFNNEWAATDFSLDLSFGDSENDFELTIPVSQLKPRYGLDYTFGIFEMAIDGTEYGGYTDTIELSTDSDTARVTGRTYHGVLASHIVEPPDGKDYRTVSGDLNACISSVLESCGMLGWFSVVDEECGIDVSNYRFERYTDAWTGLRKLCRDNGARLAIEYRDKEPWVWAQPLGETPVLDSEHASLTVSRTFPCVNHLIGLGKGDLAEREVVHAWADETGQVSVSTSAMWSGYMERAETYENTSSEDLEADTVKQLEDRQQTQTIEMDVDESRDLYGIDQVVKARMNDFGASVVTARVSQKIVKIDNGAVSVSYEVADLAREGGAS